MSSEAKRVKILVLVELVLGLVLAVAGVVIGLGAANSAPFALAGEGVVALAFGARGALIANVPARMGKLATFAAVILVIQLALVAAVVALIGPDNVANEPATVGAACVPALLTLVVLMLARGMAKRAER